MSMLIRNSKRRIQLSGIRVTKGYMAITDDIGDLLKPVDWTDDTKAIFLKLDIEPTAIRLVVTNPDDKQGYIFTKKPMQPHVYVSSRNTGRTIRKLAKLGDYLPVGGLRFEQIHRGEAL